MILDFEVLPKAIPKPINQKAIAPKRASKVFLIKIFELFLALTDPFSTSAKPAYIKNIIPVETQIQIDEIASLSEYTVLS